MCPEMDGMTQQIDLPGFRFHPTEEELLDFYLRNMVYGKRLHLDVIGFLNIYRHDPKDLPGMAKIGEREWYFFVPRDRKHGSGGRPNRTTESGFWKATGSDRKILKSTDPKRVIGLRKTLVFYKGRAPRGCRTDWVMNEYRLPDNSPSPKEVVLCKIYRKATSLKVLEQRAAQEEAETKTINNNSTPTPLLNFHAYSSSSSPPSISMDQMVFEQPDTVKVKQEKLNATMTGSSSSSSSMQLPFGLPELQVPKLSTDWNQLDPNWSLLSSPWLQNLTPTFYASLHSVSN